MMRDTVLYEMFISRDIICCLWNEFRQILASTSLIACEVRNMREL